MNRTKKVKVIGKWAADRGYDAWNIFIGKRKWCRLVAITKNPIGVMIDNNMSANINWDKVRAIKLT